MPAPSRQKPMWAVFEPRVAATKGETYDRLVLQIL